MLFRPGIPSYHPLTHRLCAILLAFLLSEPAVNALQQPAEQNPQQSQPASQQNKKKNKKPAQVDDGSAPPSALPKIPHNRLSCADSNFTGEDTVSFRRNPEADKWGEITVAQPKIWEFERMSVLLDGLLRDLEGVSLGDLTQLDPSQQNAASLKFIQSALEVGVQYDQAAAVNAANTLSSYNALHASQLQQLDQYNNYMQTLTNERNRLAAQYSAASNEVNALRALQTAGALNDAQAKQLVEAQSKQTTTQASLGQVNSLISGAGTAPTLTAPPTVTGTSVQGPASGSSMSSSLMGFADVLKSLPQGVQNNLSTALGSPSYPATKRLDNFITLLYERLAREISVLQDDLTRDPENVAFLLQFDVGLYPSKKSKDHVARVEFNLDCPGCKVYSLYPGQSSYNLANYSGASKRNTFWGNVLTLLGFGVSASYRRQTDTLQGSLVQSVYTAGFQNGVRSEVDAQDDLRIDPRTKLPGVDPGQVNANRAKQNFGWYYGPAPFEQLVSPGIRSTFALVTIPRKLIARTQDRFGNVDACLPFHIDAGWSSRNDPLAQDSYKSRVGGEVKKARWPFYDPTRTEIYPNPKCKKTDTQACAVDPDYSPFVVAMKTSVQLPASLEDYSIITDREKQKLHVLRMEYNTVYEDPEKPASSTTAQTTVQTTTLSTNPATGQTTSQTNSQTTGSSTTVGNSAASPSISSSADLGPTACPKGKCAPMLLKLDRPIDPNLTITVRGVPVMRVRDWRGRATSVLPPAQSGTDLAGSLASSGSLSLKQLAQTRGLLETDQFGPNTWFALNSHELLLNVSIDVATDWDFPTIQLADPSDSVVIPYDLRRNFTELVVDGFRLRPQTAAGIQAEFARQNWGEKKTYKSGADDGVDDPDETPCPNGSTDNTCLLLFDGYDSFISSGPYPFSTFLPIFSPEPDSRKFDATVGETASDLLISFLPRTKAQRDSATSRRFDWSGSHTRVILEDRNRDFAWSLSCDIQGDALACHIPREEISRTYFNFLRACPNDTVCPGLDTDRQPLLASLDHSVISQLTFCGFPETFALSSTAATEIRVSCGSADSISRGAVDKSLTTRQLKSTAIDSQRALLTQRHDLRAFPHAFISTLQLWVQQSDETGQNVFDSPEPASIPFLPVSEDFWGDTPFHPWSFDTADSDSVQIFECNYLPNDIPDHIYASLLGVDSWPKWIEKQKIKPVSLIRPAWVPLFADASRLPGSNCGSLKLPTAAFANDPVVFQMEFHPSHSRLDDNPAASNTPTAKPNSSESVKPPQSSAVKPESSQAKSEEASSYFPGPDRLRTTITISRSRLGPYYRGPEVTPLVIPPSADGKTPKSRHWNLRIPVERTTCSDTLEINPGLIRPEFQPTGKSSETDAAKLYYEWRTGADKLWPCLKQKPSLERVVANPESVHPGSQSQWKAADEAGVLSLFLDIPDTAVQTLPQRIDILRTTSEGVPWVVGSLPNLRDLLLPHRLTIDFIGSTQFALRGEHADVIDAVSVQNLADGTGAILQAAPAAEYTLVALPPASSSAKPDTSSDGSSGGSSTTNITVTTTKDSADKVTLTQNSSTPPAKPASPGAGTSPAPSSDNQTTKALTPGTYAIVPLMRLPDTPPSPQAQEVLQKAAADKATAQSQVTAAQKAVDKANAAAKGKAKDSKEAADQKDAQTKLDAANKKLAAAQKAATDADAKAKPTPNYMPLQVTDPKGKPLTITIPDTKRTTPTPPTTPSTTTCVAPCVVALPCAASCPPSSPTAPGKSP